MTAKHKQDFLYQPDTPIVYKLWKGMKLDSSTVKEELIRIDPTSGEEVVSLNKNKALTFSFKDTISFLNLASNQSGFTVSIQFKTQHKPAGARAAGDPWVDRENAIITLANSWFSHLWENAKLYLGTTEIETINHFGIVFETLGHLRGYEYRERSGINETFCPDTGEGNAANNGFNNRKTLYNYDVAADADYREYQAFVPLHSIFGFCLDYNRVIRNMPIKIILTRKENNKNCVFGEDHTNVDFKLTGIVLQIEQLIPSDENLVSLNDFIGKTPKIEVNFRAKACETFSSDGTKISKSLGSSYSNPRYIFIACKDPAKDGSYQQNYGKLENGNIKKITVTIGAQEYPNVAQDANFKLNKFTNFYFPLVNVCRELYRHECAISVKDFKDLYTIFAIDTSSQPERGKSEGVDIKIVIERNDLLPIGMLEYYVIIIYDRWFTMHLHDGKITQLV